MEHNLTVSRIQTRSRPDICQSSPVPGERAQDCRKRGPDRVLLKKRGPCRRFYFLQMHSRGGIFIVGEWRTQRFGECKGEQSPFPDMELILMIWFCVHSQIGLEAGTTLGISGSAPAVRF